MPYRVIYWRMNIIEDPYYRFFMLKGKRCFIHAVKREANNFGTVSI